VSPFFAELNIPLKWLRTEPLLWCYDAALRTTHEKGKNSKIPSNLSVFDGSNVIIIVS